MKFASALAATASLITLTEAINLRKRVDGPARVVHMETQRRDVQNPVLRDRLRRRQSNTVSENLDNEETLYFANVSLGTPGQQLRLHIDTGSSDLWTNVANSDLCTESGDQCGQSGTYNANDSSTYHYVNSLFNISYEDGSGASGDYATDDLAIGGVTVKNLEFGLGYQSTSQQGLLGIGYPINEAITQVSPDEQPYANAPAAMVQQGLISANAYSLWLNDLDSSTGSILFGGVDTGMYTGDLYTLPIIQEQGVYAEFIVGLTGVGVGSPNSIASNQAIPVLLDSGSSLMYLPNSIAQSIYNEFGAQYDEQEAVAIVDCSLANNQTTLQFTFAQPTIEVSMSELVLEAGTDRKGNPICILGIGPADDSTPVLGDTFIRSAYVVYDLDSNEISLAQTDFNSTTHNIMEITNGTSGVPGATAVSGAITSASVGDGGARNGGQPQITNGPATAAAGPLPTPALGAMVGAAAAGAGLLFAI